MTSRCKGWSYKKKMSNSVFLDKRIGQSYLSYLTGCLIFYFFEHFLLSLQWYSKTGEVRGLKDTCQIQQREVGKIRNKRIRAAEEIMEKAGTAVKWSTRWNFKVEGICKLLNIPALQRTFNALRSLFSSDHLTSWFSSFFRSPILTESQFFCI